LNSLARSAKAYRIKKITHLQDAETALTSQGPKSNCPIARAAIFQSLSRRLDRIPPNRLHLSVLVRLPCKLFRIWVISECWHCRICNHDRFEMEASVSHVSGCQLTDHNTVKMLTSRHQHPRVWARYIQESRQEIKV
jgi:hypothetical protein